MKQYFTKRNVIIGAISLALLVVLIVAIVMQFGSKIPVLTLDCEPTDYKESGLVYTAIPIDWRGGTKTEREMAEIANEEGYVAAMQKEAGCAMYPGRKVGFSFKDTPEHVTLNIYDQSGNLQETISLDDKDSFSLPTSGVKLYVLEAKWEKGTCAYAFWIMTL